MTKHLFLAAALLVAADGCVGPDGDPEDETASLVSAFTTPPPPPPPTTHTLYNPYWGQYLNAPTSGRLFIGPSASTMNFARIGTPPNYKLKLNGTNLCVASFNLVEGNGVVLSDCDSTAQPSVTWNEVLHSVNGFPYVEFQMRSGVPPYTAFCLDTAGGQGSTLGIYHCVASTALDSKTWKVN